MIAPRLEIDLDKIYHNASVLVKRLKLQGISVTGVTKAALGSKQIANQWLRAGVAGLGDSRTENIATMRSSGIGASMTLIRSPMLSQIDEIVALADESCNTEIAVIRQLSIAAQKADRMHRVILMVEMGDLREGIMPQDLEQTVAEVLRLPNIDFKGLGTNLACRSGVSPDARNMAELSGLADSIDSIFGRIVRVITGGNSANLEWALSGLGTGRINNLRLGEAMLLGREPLHRQPIEGLYQDAITLFAEVIETKRKPTKPWGDIAQSAFGEVAAGKDLGTITQTIFAIGRQDVDPSDLLPPDKLRIMAASSDHLVVDSSRYPNGLVAGDQVSFRLNYGALLRTMTSPFIKKVYCNSLPDKLRTPLDLLKIIA